MAENKTIGLSDLSEGTIQPEPEVQEETVATETVQEQPMDAATRARLNAEAYKAKKIAEDKARMAEIKAQQEAEDKAAHDEHMKAVYRGDEAPNSTSEVFDSAMFDINSTLGRLKRENDFMQQKQEEIQEEKEEDEDVDALLAGEKTIDEVNLDDDEDEDDDEAVTEVTPELPKKSLMDIINDLDDDDDDDDEEVAAEESKEDSDKLEKLNLTEEEWTERLKKSAQQKIKVIDESKVIDLSQFTVAEKTVSVKNAIKVVNTEELPYTSNWGLFNTGTPIIMEEFKGQEITTLLGNDNLTRYNRNREIYKLIYNHDRTEGKPEFTEWLKQISVRDIDHIYMAIYRASYGGANYIPYNCQECGEVFVSDETPLYQMIKFETPEDEKKAEEIVGKALRAPEKLKTYREQITDEYVMDFKDPSIYNMYFELALLPDDFTEENAELITYICYIDAIYVIDRQTMSLIPINLTKHDDNITKELMYKIKRYAKVLKSLSADELSKVQAKISEIVDEREVNVDYVLPETVCPRCGKTIPETKISAQDLVFTRHQLARITTM